MVIEGEDICSATSRSSNGQGSSVWFGFRIRSNGRFGHDGRLHRDGDPVGSSSGVRFFLDAHQTLIRNFPAEVPMLAALFEILFKEDRTARIRDKNSGSG